MKIIGITGTSGAGKTTVCEIIEKNYNAKKIDADKIAKELSKPGTKYYNEIVEYFGKDIVRTDREIDRKKLANIIFYDDLKRDDLNQITEKHVVKRINEEIELYSKTEETIILDVPLLFESGLNEICDETIGVIADKTLKIQRICARDGIDDKLAQKRINALKDNEFLIENCTHIITNEGDIEDIKEQIDLIFNQEIVYKNNDKIRYLQFRKLLEYPEINHAFVIKPLDLKNAEKDILIENYKPIIEEFNLDIEEIVKPYQTHTDNICNITEEQGIYIEKLKDVDGLITDKNKKALSLVFADCMPIYLYDPVKRVIGNIHSGWKGTLKQIAKKAVLQMQKNYGCNPINIVAVLGPAIRKCHFEVDEDVYILFKNEFEYMDKWADISQKCEADKYKIDMALINKIMLIEAGLNENNVIDSKVCTMCSRKIMHSYRAEKEKSRKKYKYYIFKIKWGKICIKHLKN